MPEFPDTPDTGTGSTSSTGATPVAAGVEHASSILTTASGNVDATGGGTELFADPHDDRRRVTITNTHATETNYLYVLLCTTAGTPTISATVFTRRISGAGQAPVAFDIGPGVRVFIFGVAGNTSYLASEESIVTA